LSPSHLLEVRDLHTHFATQDGLVQAVNGVSLYIDPGESLGIVGESGGGKSVTALSIMGLIPAPGRVVAGEVEFDGRDLLRLSEDERRHIRGNEIAIIFQDPMSYLNPVMTVGRQISEGLRLHKGMGRRAAHARAIDLMKLLGVPDATSGVDKYPHQFSGGMRQRVMIAMALSCEPKLLIADEPTTALDVTVGAQILELLQRLRSDLGMALVLITHDLGIVAGTVDRVNVMYAGQIAETASVDQTFADPRHPYTLGLLASVPRLDAPRGARLQPIPGVPPDLIDPLSGCPFFPRCPYSVERCVAVDPPLELVAPTHWTACWVDTGTAPRHVPGVAPVVSPEAQAEALSSMGDGL